VCEIAFQELNDNARKEVARLIRQDAEFKTFAESCVWPDHPKQRASEHFINVPRDFASFSTEACPTAPTCLFTAIKKELRVLSTSTNDKARLAALKFLGHWIGDLHQPLHVSFADDRGGGKIWESGLLCTVNLHGVWDSCIVERKLGTDWRAVARDLEEDIMPEDRGVWTSTTMETWANESLIIARSAAVQYCVVVGNKCVYAANNEAFEEGETEKVVLVDAAYLEANGPIVAKRLRQAGVRLATMLNATIGK
jgi:hypothetical protein